MFGIFDIVDIILLCLMVLVTAIFVKIVCKKIGYWMTEGMLDKIKKEKGDKHGKGRT